MKKKAMKEPKAEKLMKLEKKEGKMLGKMSKEHMKATKMPKKKGKK